MRHAVIWFAAVVVLTAAISSRAVENRIGAGVHYWKTIDELKDEFEDLDDSGLAWMIVYQYKPVRLLAAELDVEIFPEGFAGSTDVAYAPQVYLVVGAAVYAAAGAGIVYTDELGDPFYALRAGLDLEVLPSIFLDINANYQVAEWRALRDVKENVGSYTLGAAAKLEF